MRADEQSIDALERAIFHEANSEVEQIRAEARAKSDEIRQRAAQHAEAERKSILARAAQEAERVRSQFVATTQLKARTLELERREKLLNEIFKAAGEKLPSLAAKKNYEDSVAQMLRDAVSQLNASKAVVQADKQTQKVLEGGVLVKVAKELKAEISVEKPLEHETGLIVKSVDGRLKFDSTLETRLARKQN